MVLAALLIGVPLVMCLFDPVYADDEIDNSDFD
jgi:hypothetical protein